jgi:hypothetical protein
MLVSSVADRYGRSKHRSAVSSILGIIDDDEPRMAQHSEPGPWFAIDGLQMLEVKPGFRQLHGKSEYPRLEDMGLIGDGITAALVSLDGSIPWLCLPRFDSEPVFCGLLDVATGGHFVLAPEEIVEARQYYEPDTAVLHTEFQTKKGRVRITDAMAVRAGADLTDDAPGGRAELVRSAVVLDGSVQLRVELEPRGADE